MRVRVHEHAHTEPLATPRTKRTIRRNPITITHYYYLTTITPLLLPHLYIILIDEQPEEILHRGGSLSAAMSHSRPRVSYTKFLYYLRG